jgi:hypothetical protein
MLTYLKRQVLLPYKDISIAAVSGEATREHDDSWNHTKRMNILRTRNRAAECSKSWHTELPLLFSHKQLNVCTVSGCYGQGSISWTNKRVTRVYLHTVAKRTETLPTQTFLTRKIQKKTRYLRQCVFCYKWNSCVSFTYTAATILIMQN